MTFPRKTLPALIGLALAAWHPASLASNQYSVYQEQGQLIRAPQAVAALGPDLFGDRVNLYTGSLEFLHTDVSLPGNNALPVAIGRRLRAGSSTATLGPGTFFGRWDLDIPRLHGIYADAGWTVFMSGAEKSRCTYFREPAPFDPAQGIIVEADKFWRGHFLYVPGMGDQELLERAPGNTHAPNNEVVNYPVVTANQWSLKCLPTLANAPTEGEGFLAVSPDGTQYQFDWMVSRRAHALLNPSGGSSTASTQDPATASVTTSASDGTAPEKNNNGNGNDNGKGTGNGKDKGDGGITPTGVSGGQLVLRREVWILPTKITDRFGNTVTYTYDATRHWQLKTIQSSDGRTLNLTYHDGTDLIRTVSDGTRTWTYDYDNYTNPNLYSNLNQVTQPDGSAWQLSGIYSLLTDVQYQGAPSCHSAGTLYTTPVSGSMTHPSGAVGSFTLTPVLHGRSWVPQQCMDDNAYAYYPNHFASLSLTSKTLTGPGMAAASWTYDYGQPNASWDTDCAGGCLDTKTVNVTDPDGDVTRYTFGNRFFQTEGKLQKTEVLAGGGTVLRTTDTRYRAPDAGPYPYPVGITKQERGDGYLGTLLMPEDRRVITQQGTTFTWQANGFDGLARVTSATKSSSLGDSRTEATVYHDNRVKWVLGQIDRVTETDTGAVLVQNTYDPATAALLSVTRFGALEQSMTYHADGTLATRKDGANHTTTFGNYHRGIARNVGYADGSSESAVVNDIGLITAVTDAAGHTTGYGYDLMGRLARITRPAGDTVAWNDTILSFVPVAADEVGLPAGHWRQTVTTGNAVSVTYLDALWRPVLSKTYDTANEAATRKMVVRAYDAQGRTTYESYPQRTIAAYTDRPAGTATDYDALGRTTSVRADSELGALTTSIAYLPGFQKQVTNPRGKVTTTRYQAFDVPSEDAAVAIAAPEGVNVAISRDRFGKPTAITRSGPGQNGTVSATRRYVYDDKQRLCKTVEPETGATLQDYDGANNILWRAPGQSLTSLTCDRTSVAAAAKISYGYDTRNRLISTSYGDGSPGIARTYTADGLPETIVSNGATWTTSYNKRRLPTSEVLSYNSQTYTLGWGYNPNGHVSQLTYPSGKSVAYAPNALGEPTQVGSYATGIAYHPNGAVAGFTYGNGIVRSLTQNTRGLPHLAKDTGVLQDQYTYDANANVTAIADLQEGITSRSLGYDGLDRLTSANAPNVWGNASYSYDALDNLIASTIGSRSNAYTYDAATNRLTSLASTASAYSYAYGYDARGNITSRGAQGFTFDLGNRLTAATNKATYAYDGFGRRLKTVSQDGTTTLSIYSPAGQLLHTRQSGGPNPAKSTDYVYLHRHAIAEVSK